MKSDETSHLETLTPYNLQDQVRDELLRLILTGVLAPRTRLLEAAIARQFGVSRGPVREAARQLEKRGLLTFEPRRGFFVKRYEFADIEGIYQYRECLEVAAIRLAIGRMSDSDVEELERRADAVIAREGQDEAASLDLIFDFHRLIFARSGNARFLQAFDDAVWELRQVLVAVHGYDEPAANITYFREWAPRIVKAFRERDADEAERVLMHYLRLGLEQTRVLFEKAEASAADTGWLAPKKFPLKEPTK